jgi:hypothetical protein
MLVVDTGNDGDDGLGDLLDPNCQWISEVDPEAASQFGEESFCRSGCDVETSFKSEVFDNAVELVFGTKTSVGYLCGVQVCRIPLRGPRSCY